MISLQSRKTCRRIDQMAPPLFFDFDIGNRAASTDKHAHELLNQLLLCPCRRLLAKNGPAGQANVLALMCSIQTSKLTSLSQCDFNKLDNWPASRFNWLCKCQLQQAEQGLSTSELVNHYSVLGIQLAQVGSRSSEAPLPSFDGTTQAYWVAERILPSSAGKMAALSERWA